MTKVRLRPAGDEDFDFLWRLHRLTMKPYVTATWGWDEQFQANRFRENFDASALRVIEFGGQAVGVLGVRRGPDSIYIGTIEIEPDFQRQGLGSRILRDVLRQGDEAGLPVRLQVLKSNPASRLYHRMGFAVVEETETHHVMEYQPTTGSPMLEGFGRPR